MACPQLNPCIPCIPVALAIRIVNYARIGLFQGSFEFYQKPVGLPRYFAYTSTPLIDDKTFELYYKKYRASVSYFFSRQGFTIEETKDLTQEVFLRVYKNRNLFREEASFRTWVHKIAANHWKNQVRDDQTNKRKGVVVSLDESNADNFVKPEREHPLTGLIQRERSQQIKKAIKHFPEQMRNCILLRTYQGLKYREIASTLKVSVETVKTQLHLARERLAQELSEPES